jgi:hypothetical protein
MYKKNHFEATENQAKTRFVWQNQGTVQQEVLLNFWVIS